MPVSEYQSIDTRAEVFFPAFFIYQTLQAHSKPGRWSSTFVYSIYFISAAAI